MRFSWTGLILAPLLVPVNGRTRNRRHAQITAHQMQVISRQRRGEKYSDGTPS
jgi:hypothetical protein